MVLDDFLREYTNDANVNRVVMQTVTEIAEPRANMCLARQTVDG